MLQCTKNKCINKTRRHRLDIVANYYLLLQLNICHKRITKILIQDY